MIRLLTIGRESHSWHGVHTGLSDVFEVHGDVPEKKQSTVRRLYDGLNAGWESNVRSPGAKWNIDKAVCLMLPQKCLWLKEEDALVKKLDRITITATAWKRRHAFWYRTTGCTDIHLFINLFKAAVSLCLYVPWWRQALEIHEKCLSKVCRVCFFFFALLGVCFLKCWKAISVSLSLKTRVIPTTSQHKTQKCVELNERCKTLVHMKHCHICWTPPRTLQR